MFWHYFPQKLFVQYAFYFSQILHTLPLVKVFPILYTIIIGSNPVLYQTSVYSTPIDEGLGTKGGPPALVGGATVWRPVVNFSQLACREEEYEAEALYLRPE